MCIIKLCVPSCTSKQHVYAEVPPQTRFLAIPSVEIFCLLLHRSTHGRRNSVWCLCTVRKARHTSTYTHAPTPHRGDWELVSILLTAGQWEQLSFWHFLAPPIRYIACCENFKIQHSIHSRFRRHTDTKHRNTHDTHTHGVALGDSLFFFANKIFCFRTSRSARRRQILNCIFFSVFFTSLFLRSV